MTVARKYGPFLVQGMAVCVLVLAPYFCVQLFDPIVTPMNLLGELPKKSFELLMLELEPVIFSTVVAFYLLRLNSTFWKIASLSALLGLHVFTSLLFIFARSEGAFRWW